MAKRSNGKTSQETLSKRSDSKQGRAEPPRSADGWITLRKASEESGVSISTLRNWYRKGLIDSRVEKGPNGSQRIVRREDVVARTKARAAAPDDYSSRSDPAPESGPVELSVTSSLNDLIAEHAVACERAGRAEARTEFLERELEELRARLASSTSERYKALQAENEMLRERLELLRSQAEEMARRLSSIEGEPEEIDLDDRRRIPPPEEDEYLALTQRWKVRRRRRRAARRTAKASRASSSSST